MDSTYSQKDLTLSQKDSKSSQKDRTRSQRSLRSSQKNTNLSLKNTNLSQKDTNLSQKDTLSSEKDLINSSQRELRSSRRGSLDETSRVSSRSSSSSTVTNASLQLLKADFIAYALLVQGKCFKNISKNSSQSGKSSNSEPTTAKTDFNTQNLPNPSQKSGKFDTKSDKSDSKFSQHTSKDTKLSSKSSQITPKDPKLSAKNSKLSQKNSKLSQQELKGSNKGLKSSESDSKYDPKSDSKSSNLPFNPKLSYFNGLNCQKHSYLSFFEGLDLFVNSHRFDELFSQFENYVIKLFSVHPTLGSVRRGGYIDDDGQVIGSMLNYIRSYESSLHLLSQKQGNYFYISLYLLIVLLRNLRRLLHHYRANSTLLELLLILVEGVYLCQNHLYRFFVRSHWQLLQEKMKFYDPNDKNYKQYNSIELLKTLNDNCNQFRNSIYNICKAKSQPFYSNSQSHPNSKSHSNYDSNYNYNLDNLNPRFELKIGKYDENLDTMVSQEYGSNPVGAMGSQVKLTSREPDHMDESRLLEEDLSEFETARDPFSIFYDNVSSLPTGSLVDKSLEYDLVEISEFSEPSFLLDDKVSEWISELCTLASFYCKLGNEPILLRSQFLKHRTDSQTMLPKLSKHSYTNFSFGRILHLKLLDSLYYIRLSSNLTETPYRPSEVQLAKPKRSDAEERPVKKRYTRWSDDEVDILVKAINRHGIGNWSFITRAYFLGTKSPMQLKDKWANLTRYSHVKQVEPPKTKLPEIKKWTLVHTHN